MNEQIRKAAREALADSGMSQQALAERANIRQATVSRLLSGERQGEPKTWERLLDALGLELVAVPKGTDVGKLIEKGRE